MTMSAGSALPEKRQPWRKPAAWLYYPLAVLSMMAGALVLGVRIRRDPAVRKLRGPLIIIGNHPSYPDPFYMASALFPRRINFLTTQGFFRSPFIASCLRKLGALPKTQFRTDMQAMRNMMGVIRRKGTLAIYPEGQRSLVGIPNPIDTSISKFIWKMHCPVVAVIEDGAYLTWPRWSKSGIRPGRVEVRTRLLFTRDQLSSMDVPAIQSAIEKALAYNDYDWQRENRRRFWSRAPARGLHNICHKCPSCGRDYAMTSRRNLLTCRFCGNAGQIDTYGLIKPAGGTGKVYEDAAQWRRWQVSEISGFLAHEGAVMNIRASLVYPADGTDARPGGSGWLRLTSSQMTYDEEGAPEGQSPLTIRFPFSGVAGISADYGRHFEIIQADRLYRFIPEESQAVAIVADAVQAAAERPAPGLTSKTGRPVPEQLEEG